MQWMTAFAVAFGLYAARNGLPPVYPGDVVALVIVGLLFAYCVRGQRKPAGQQGAGERLAFRLGQALKRIRRA